MKKGIVFSSTKIISHLIIEMVEQVFKVDEVVSYDDLKEKLSNNNYDFMIIDRTLKDTTSKEIFNKLISDGIENIPPSILLTQDKYNFEEDGKGYSFILRKPFLKSEIIEAINFVTTSRDNIKKVKNILIVDDSELSRKIIKKKLKKFNFNIIETDSPIKALSLLETQKPELIIVDYEMPELNGIEFAREVANTEKYMDVPIILVTASKDIEMVKEEGFNSGISAYFQKPVNEEEIEQFFSNYVGKELFSNILILDDSSTKRKILYSNLAINSNKVITCENIKKAIGFIEDNHFDVVLIDLVLKNENAFDAIKMIRKINKNIPIVVYSSIADRKNIYKVLELGANDYLWAPIEMKELILKSNIWINYYNTILENISLKKIKLKEKPQDFIEILEEKFAFSNANNITSSLVYIPDIDKDSIEKIKKSLRKNDVTGFINNKFYIFLDNSDYITSLKICNRLKKITGKEIKFGISTTDSHKTLDNMIEYSEKNIIE